jgi:PAS domain S-box-containing protein
MALNELVHPGFLIGGGTMGELMRTKDWSKTELGEPEAWPQSLKTLVSIILNSQFPMFVWWGRSLMTFYNDSYIAIAGKKHPDLLGRSGNEAWSEIWDVVGPLADTVMTKGESTWAEDQVLYMNRKGYTEETYFTFSYSPVFSETGSVQGVFCACTETTAKVLSARNIEESERNLRSTILQAPVAMCIMRGEDFKVTIANDRMLELWGKSASEMLHKPLFTGLPEAKNQGFEELLERVYKNGETIVFNEREAQLPSNGSVQTKFINFVYEPFHEADGTISGVIVVAVEVTEQVKARKRIEESEQDLQRRISERTVELEKANTELKRSNENLEEFAYAASHDMKEPIRKIHFFADRLKDHLREKLDENDKRLFERMEHSARRMSALIDDLLLYSHITKGSTIKETVDLNQKISAVLGDLELEIEEKKARINIQTLPTIQGYRRQLQQLFQNLISNALKYHKSGEAPEIDITATMVTAAEAGAPVSVNPENKYHLIEVKDKGIGFEQKYADKIFNVFTRLHGNAEYKGTGVGLSIVRKVMENHEGFIRAESVPGEGSSFKVYFPADV